MRDGMAIFNKNQSSKTPKALQLVIVFEVRIHCLHPTESIWD